MDIIDISSYAQPRDRSQPSKINVTPARSVTREDRTPPVDWTGHAYKSPADCIRAGIDYSRIGRESSARENSNGSNGCNA